uniref:Uncharacterized protein n=1 Tax=Calcidiscus leptoporus TaxID=127549 RepID=A0A7S0J9D7_9EUKA|mmetsp:Transcript_46220/g.107666  ORF Transcript_46220/g.107666 Transcript_46220/m.107666 type:complete len:444 (+) Transcript_46220:36-1367(+)
MPLASECSQSNTALYELEALPSWKPPSPSLLALILVPPVLGFCGAALLVLGRFRWPSGTPELQLLEQHAVSLTFKKQEHETKYCATIYRSLMPLQAALLSFLAVASAVQLWMGPWFDEVFLFCAFMLLSLVGRVVVHVLPERSVSHAAAQRLGQVSWQVLQGIFLPLHVLVVCGYVSVIESHARPSASLNVSPPRQLSSSAYSLTIFVFAWLSQMMSVRLFPKLFSIAANLLVIASCPNKTAFSDNSRLVINTLAQGLSFIIERCIDSLHRHHFRLEQRIQFAADEAELRSVELEAARKEALKKKRTVQWSETGSGTDATVSTQSSASRCSDRSARLRQVLRPSKNDQRVQGLMQQNLDLTQQVIALTQQNMVLSEYMSSLNDRLHAHTLLEQRLLSGIKTAYNAAIGEEQRRLILQLVPSAWLQQDGGNAEEAPSPQDPPRD